MLGWGVIVLVVVIWFLVKAWPGANPGARAEPALDAGQRQPRRDVDPSGSMAGPQERAGRRKIPGLRCEPCVTTGWFRVGQCRS